MRVLKRMEHIERHGTYPEPWMVPESFRWLYRLLIGRPMDNVVRTNATFWRDATSGWDSRWLRLAGWKRAAVRVSVLYFLALTLALTFATVLGFGEFAFRVFSLHLLLWGALLSPVLAYRRVRDHGLSLPLCVERETEEEGEVSLVRRWERVQLHEGRREWEKEKIIPLARALAPMLGMETVGRDAREWVTVPRTYMEEHGRAVEILLPAHFTGTDGQRKNIERAAAAKLGMLEVSARWQLDGRAPRLLLTAPPAPPEKALYPEYAGILASTQEYRPYLGVVAGGELLSAEMIDASPHLFLSAGPGAGKSELIKSLIMQALHWGWFVIILDWKAASHSWAKGLPGVRYVTSVEGIHDMGVQLGEEVDRRKNVCDDDGRVPDGTPKLLVVREEWNITSTMLADYWANLRATADQEERRTMGVRSPALLGYQALDFTGRQFQMFDFLVAQRASNRVFNFNVDLRECFNIKLLARYSAQTVKMLCPNIKPFPRMPKQVGRWVVAVGDEAQVIQGILITGEQARAFASAGQDNPASPWVVVSGSNYRAQGDRLPRGVAGGGTSDVIEGEEVPPAVTMKLNALAELTEPYGITYKMLQHARDRDQEGFPSAYGGNQFSGYTYERDAVILWARRVHARKRVEGGK